MVVQGQVVVLVGERRLGNRAAFTSECACEWGIDRFDGGINGGVMKYSAEAVDTAMT